MAEKSWRLWSPYDVADFFSGYRPSCSEAEHIACMERAKRGSGCRYVMPEHSQEFQQKCRALEMVIREMVTREVDGEAKIGGGRIREPGYAGMDDNEEAIGE